MKKAVIYVRVSTDEQKKYGTGLEYQIGRCREYAASMELEIFNELSDGGVSGKTPINERPSGAQLYRHVSERRVTDVVVTRADRLSRDEFGLETPLFFKHCVLNDVTLHLADEGGAVSRGMGGKLLLTVADMNGGEERKKNLQRQIEGRRARARNGRVLVCGRRPPFGYKTHPVHSNGRTRLEFEIDPGQAEIVREIFRLYLEERLSMRAIAINLNKRGTMGTWWRENIRRVITNTRYIGEFVYAGIVVTQEALAIIDRDTYERARVLVVSNKLSSPRRTLYQYLFRGRITCKCGRKLRGRNMRGRLKYYCRSSDEEKNRCKLTKTYDVTQIDSDAWGELVKTLNNVPLLKEAARRYVERQQSEMHPKQQRIAHAKSEQLEARKAKDEYVRLAGRVGADSPLLSEYENAAQRELTRGKALDAEIERLEKELAYMARYDEDEIDRVVETVRTKMQGNPTFRERRDLIERLNVTGEVDGDAIHFSLELGLAFTVSRASLFLLWCAAPRSTR